MRRRGVLTSSRHFRAGDHVCWTHTGGPERRETLSAFFAEGLERGERLAYFGPQALRDDLPDVIGTTQTSTLTGDGSLVVLRSEDAYTPGTTFDDVTLLGAWGQAIRSSIDAGFTGLRAVGEAGWLLAHLGPTHAFTRYELGADLLAARLPITAACSYDGSTLDARALGIARSVHPLVLSSSGTAIADVGYTMTALDHGVVAIDGELDVLYADALAALVVDLAPQIRTLDLSGLRFADVAAVRALARAGAAMRAANGDARFVGAPATFRRTWDLLRFNELSEVAFADA